MDTSFARRVDFATSTSVLVFLGVLTLSVGLFDGGVLLQALFYVVLALFSTFVSYRLTIHTKRDIIREDIILSLSERNVEVRPDLFPPQIVVSDRPHGVEVDTAVPANLPRVGYENSLAAAVTEEAAETDADLARSLEAQAHGARVLLSTDALRHFIATTPAGVDAAILLSTVIASAKQKYPSEDGWVVINESRMREACVECLAVPMAASADAPYVPTIVPAGVGSLAEMIAAGNLGAAFSLIGHRPMFSLADAVADFDALYRSRNGEDTNTSDLLKEVTADIPTDTIKAITIALTSALDGTYTDEAEAVKTAIMKAVKVRG